MGTLSLQTLDEHAASLERIVARTDAGEHPIPVDFWDVCSPATRRAHYDEYYMAHTLALPELAPYLALLGRAFDRFARMKSGADTAVAVALAILEDTSAYIRSGGSTRMIRALPWLDQPQRASSSGSRSSPAARVASHSSVSKSSRMGCGGASTSRGCIQKGNIGDDLQLPPLARVRLGVV